MRSSKQPLPSRRPNSQPSLPSSLNLKSLHISSSAPPHRKRKGCNTNAIEDGDAKENHGFPTLTSLSGSRPTNYPLLCHDSSQEAQPQQVPCLNLNKVIDSFHGIANYTLGTKPLLTKSQHENNFDDGLGTNRYVLNDRKEHTDIIIPNIFESNGRLHIKESYRKISEEILLLSPLDSTNVPLEEKVTNHVFSPLSPLILLLNNNTIPDKATDCNETFSKIILKCNSEVQIDEKYAHKSHEYLRELDKSKYEPFDHLKKSNANLQETDESVEEKDGYLQESGKSFDKSEEYLPESERESPKLKRESDDHLYMSGEQLQTAKQMLLSEESLQESDVSIITFSPLSDVEAIKSVSASQMSDTVQATPPSCIKRKDPPNCSQINLKIHEHESNGKLLESQLSLHSPSDIRHYDEEMYEEARNPTALSNLHKDNGFKGNGITNDRDRHHNDASDVGFINEIKCSSSKSENLMDGAEKLQDGMIRKTSRSDSVSKRDTCQQSTQDLQPASSQCESKAQKTPLHIEDRICLDTVKSKSPSVREPLESQESSHHRITVVTTDTEIENILPTSLPTESMLMSHKEDSIRSDPEVNIISFSPLTNSQGLMKVMSTEHSSTTGHQHVESPDEHYDSEALTNLKKSADCNEYCNDQSVNPIRDKSFRKQYISLPDINSGENEVLEQNRPIVVPEIAISSNDPDLFKTKLLNARRESSVNVSCDSRTKGDKFLIQGTSAGMKGIKVPPNSQHCYYSEGETCMVLKVEENVKHTCMKSIAPSNDKRQPTLISKSGDYRHGRRPQYPLHETTLQKQFKSFTHEHCSTQRAKYSSDDKQHLSMPKCDERLQDISLDSISCCEEIQALQTDFSNKGYPQHNSCVAKSLQTDRVDKVYDVNVHICTESQDVVGEQVVPDHGFAPCDYLKNNESYLTDLPSINNKEKPKPVEINAVPGVYTWTPLFAAVNDSVCHNDGLYVSGQTTAISSLVPQAYAKRSIRVGLSKHQKVKRLHRHL